MLARTLDQIPAQYLKGVGPQIGKLLEKCHIKTIQDILFHLPYRYQDRTKISFIKNAQAGEWIVIEGYISNITQPKKRFVCELTDVTGSLYLLFFHINHLQKSAFKTGLKLRCFGEIKYSSFGRTLIHPEYEFLEENNQPPIDQTLTPIYPSTEGLTQIRWRKITAQALHILNSENLPDYLKNINHKTLSITDCLKYIHRPPPEDKNALALLLEKKHPAQLRLAFEELLAHYLSLKMRREKIKYSPAPVFNLSLGQKNIEKFLGNLSFTLTTAQKKVIREICKDIQQPHPMMRLIQGDVGCGKTIVAAIAALYAVSNHCQTALMVPTELLSEQHYQNFCRWFSDDNISIIWLNAGLKLSEKKKALEKIAREDNLIIIGTHALFQEKVKFKNLGLVIIDEQHRFGVEQRLALKEKGFSPHQLMMTATPIPRTLAMTCYADLDISIIDELPPNRTPIKTVIMSQHRRDEIIMRLLNAYKEKRQIYWVCTLIEESENLQCQAAQATARTLQQALPSLNIQLIHGKLKSAEKEKTMTAFKGGKIDLLVATTVIEVGVDVPAASVMIIENAERLGLSQLHQLRGRVGRGSQDSYCILLYQPPLSLQAQERLTVLRDYQDGFKIAEKDLSLRGPGEFFGTKQTGLLNLRIADLVKHQNLFENIQRSADIMLKKSFKDCEHLIARWVGEIEKFQAA